MENSVRRCKDCGAALPEGTSSQRRYCDACRKLRRKEINHNYQKKAPSLGKPRAARGTLLHRVRQGTPGGVCGEPEVLHFLWRKGASGASKRTRPAGVGS